MERLHAEARQQAEAEWQPLQREIDHYAIAPQDQRQLEPAQAKVKALLAQDTYFGYLDAPAQVRACRKVFDRLRLPERDRLRDQTARLLRRLQAEMADYVMPQVLREELGGELAETEGLLAGIPTYADARAARDKIGRCEAELQKSLMMPCLERAVLTGHTKWVNAVAFSPDGATLASGATDKTVRLWGQVVRREEWERKERERKERERRAWRAVGRCEACGAKLGFLEKRKHTRCQRHR